MYYQWIHPDEFALPAINHEECTEMTETDADDRRRISDLYERLLLTFEMQRTILLELGPLLSGTYPDVDAEFERLLAMNIYAPAPLPKVQART